MLDCLRSSACLLHATGQGIEVGAGQLFDGLMPQMGRNVQIETGAVVVDTAVAAFAFLEHLPDAVEGVAGQLFSSGLPYGLALLLVGLVLAFDAQTANRCRLRSGHVVAELPSDLFFDEFAILTVTDEIDFFETVSVGARSLHKEDACVADHGLPFSACHRVFSFFTGFAPHLYSLLGHNLLITAKIAVSLCPTLCPTDNVKSSRCQRLFYPRNIL